MQVFPTFLFERTDTLSKHEEKLSWYCSYVVYVFTLRGVSADIQSIWIHNITENLVSLVMLDDDTHNSCS